MITFQVPHISTERLLLREARRSDFEAFARDSDNLASIRVSEHLGMRFEAEVDFYGGRTGRYAIDMG